MDTLFSFKAFLSHKYEYPEVNLYFFDLFNKIAQVQFELDAGKGATNVTRLERMIRDSDAFIGIYPFLGTLDGADKKQQLLEQSKYFRLETEIAVRSQKPAIIFYDKRYGEMLKPPQQIFSISFDIDEITGKGESPNRENFASEITRFQELLKFNKSYEDRIHKEKNKIAVFVPPSADGSGGYTIDCIEKIKTILADKADFDIEVIASNAVLDLRQLRFLDKIDFAVIDAGDDMMRTGIPAYLHGKFVPMLRLHFQNEEAEVISAPLSNGFLFGGVEAGYQKDIICWNKKEVLQEKLAKRLDRINAGYRRVNTTEEATQYFNSAAIKDKKVFLSYAGADEAVAMDFDRSLRKRFKTIFNYRDKESIPGGKPWMEVVYDRISASDVVIPLYSQPYFASDHCVHELQHMLSEKDNGKKILVYPVRLYKGPEGEKFELPNFAAATQYIRKYEFAGTDEIVESIMKQLPD